MPTKLIIIIIVELIIFSVLSYFLYQYNSFVSLTVLMFGFIGLATIRFNKDDLVRYVIPYIGFALGYIAGYLM